MQALENKVKAAFEFMEGKFDETRTLDIYSFANQAERSDHASNLAKLNYVLLTGNCVKFYQIRVGHYDTFNLGMRSDDFPSDLAGQHTKAMILVKDLVSRVLNRDEEFTVTLRKTVQRRYVKNSSQVLLPPLEVLIQIYSNLCPTLRQCLNFLLQQVKMELKSAVEFRAKGAALSKARTDGFGHIFFGNCTTLSTRIRCDVSLSNLQLSYTFMLI